jgi:prepilin-type N-terminal cleavage/methylation domain-containing protein
MPIRFHSARNARRGFTLVELMVVIVIIAILSSLTLAGLAGARQRAKIEKTKSTIRKVDTVIQPMYASYATRRVATAPAVNRKTFAENRLLALRLLMAEELPDNWSDTYSFPTPPTVSPAAKRYAAYKNAKKMVPGSLFETNVPSLVPPTTYGNLFANAETLFMILSLGPADAGCMENFRADEFGDIDGDTALEFHDGWGRPIMFIRWPAQYPATLSAAHDPMDALRLTTDRALTPLIFSAGPDEAVNDPLGASNGYGIQLAGNWLPGPIPSTCSGNNQGEITNPDAARDNITNFDLSKK